jgi:DNA polymerase elongation subunit (family B)
MFNARCIKHEIKQPSSYRHIDIERIVRRKFKLVSYSLDYLCKYFNTKHKKLDHSKFPGMILWVECMNGNIEAWEEMRRYNEHDVLSTEDLYNIVSPWDNSINFSVYTDNTLNKCNCGGGKFRSKGYAYTATGKFKRLVCSDCGKNYQSKQNELTLEKERVC